MVDWRHVAGLCIAIGRSAVCRVNARPDPAALLDGANAFTLYIVLRGYACLAQCEQREGVHCGDVALIGEGRPAETRWHKARARGGYVRGWS